MTIVKGSGGEERGGEGRGGGRGAEGKGKEREGDRRWPCEIADRTVCVKALGSNSPGLSTSQGHLLVPFVFEQIHNVKLACSTVTRDPL